MNEDNHNDPEKKEAVEQAVAPQAEEVKELFPICPHCNADPLMPNFRAVNIGPVRSVAFFCTACRKCLGLFLLPSAPPMMQPPRIIRPQ